MSLVKLSFDNINMPTSNPIPDNQYSNCPTLLVASQVSRNQRGKDRPMTFRIVSERSCNYVIGLRSNKSQSSYNDSLKQRGSLSIWFDPEMVWTPPPSGKRGRQQQFSDAAIQTCLTLKVLFGMPLRQTTGFVQSLLRLVGLDWVAPLLVMTW